MKYIYTILIISVLFIGCGYKAEPIYIDNKEVKIVK